jgi:bifunctional non-homologous end joining protein LigD
MGLRKYFSKRNFKKTPEPKGVHKKSKSKKLAFVVQEHHASRLHYDFRLELDGVLKSWAVPKGPSMDPHARHLAVHVEDHPFEYRKFEGVIPEGNYGAGNVIIWDEGTYEPYHDGPDDEATLRKEYKKGHLTFFLHGKKLNGEFALIKMHGKDEKAWLLIKKGDQFASKEDITKQDMSVKSGKKVDDFDGKTGHIGIDFSDTPKTKEPWRVKPMLCTLVDEPFTKDGWLFEIKWDGYRAIASKHDDTIELYSRNDNDFSVAYPPVTEAMRLVKHDVIFDGEIVVTDKEGTPRFEALQHWRREPIGTLHYYVFDILWIDGHDVRGLPLIERKKILESVIPKNTLIRYSDHVMKRGEVLFGEIKKRGLEGIVAKQIDAPYRENNRGAAWLKIKTHLRQEVVIGGFTEPRGSRQYLGALMVGVYDKDGNFIYTGHSGGGIPDNQRKLLRKQLEKIERKTSPFNIEPKPNAPVHWVQPKYICEMSFTEWTTDGSMRHPQFEGMRPDKKPENIHREIVRSTEKVKKEAEKPVLHTKLEFTHLDKVFFPKYKITKGDMVTYYESVAEYILPYLEDRPLSLLRQPNGITGEGFFQKNHEHLPKWVPSADIFSESNDKNLHWIVGGELDTLLYIVQLGSIEVNPWNSRIKHLQNPDWLVIDLDPEGVKFNDVITVAQEVKKVCDEWGAEVYAKTSGKTGIHIFMPLGAKYSYEQAKNFAHLLALEVNKRQPKLTSVERMPKKRQHKIYLDFLQNREGQTLAAPYSLRPTPEANVSMPLHWDEVKKGLKPNDFTIKNTHDRLRKEGDLWKPVLGKGVDIAKIIKSLE